MKKAQTSETASNSGEWRGCSFNKEVLRFEAELIKRAFRAGGNGVMRAAQMLVLSHQTLSGMLKTRHAGLYVPTNLRRQRNDAQKKRSSKGAGK